MSARSRLAGVVAVLAVLALVALFVLGRDGSGRDPAPAPTAGSPTSSTGTVVATDSCLPGPEHAAPTIDLGVQASTQTSLLSQERIDKLVALAKEAGATVISTSTSWRFLQPSPGAALRFEGIDRVISSARAAGLQVRLQLVGTPQWAVTDGKSWSENRPPLSRKELAAWTGFVTAVAAHVKDTVAFLEVWNEPNSKTYWPTGPSPRAFAALMAASYDPVKAVAPDLQVITGGLSGNDIGYLEHVYDAVDELGLTTRPFDLVGAHPFTGAASPDTKDPARVYQRDPFGLYDENFTGYVGLHDTMAARGDADKDLYIGAFGYGLQTVGGTPGVPDDVRATYVTEALKDVTCTPFVRAFSWYYLHPTPFDSPAWTLVDEQLRPNQTYAAFVAWTTAAP